MSFILLKILEVFMTKEELQSRIEQLQKAIEQSKQQIEQASANHNALIVRLSESQDLMRIFFAEEPLKTVEEPAQVVEGEVV